MFCVITNSLGLVITSLYAESELVTDPVAEHVESEVTTTSVRGRVVLPDDVSARIDVNGISLDQAIITLEGHYQHPRMPYPENWREITSQEREKWLNEFKLSEAYESYQEKVKKALQASTE